MDKEIFKEIGMTDYETEIYLSLLEHGQISAYQVAEKTGLYRQVTYDSINRLLEKGFLSRVKDGKTFLYKAIDPKLILAHLNERTDRYKEILPSLVSIDKASKQPMVVETYKGKNVLRICFKDIINKLKEQGGENWCTAVDEEAFKEQGKVILDQFERDMLHNKFKEKVIIKEGIKGIFQKGSSKYRKIKKEFFNENPTQIYGDNVSILVRGNPNHLIIIRNKAVAESYRKQFQLLWSMAKQ